MFDIQDLMAQAKVMQEKVRLEQEKLSATEYIGKAGGHLVTITLSGKGAMHGIHIDPSLLKLEEKTVLEDLIIAAYNEARTKVDNASASLISGMMGGMTLPPGFKMPS